MKQENSQQYQDDEIDLFELWNSIWSQKWLILFVTSITVLLAAIYMFMAPPVYKGSALVQVQQVQFNEVQDSKSYFSIEPEKTTVKIINEVAPAQLSAEKSINGVLNITMASIHKESIKNSIEETYQLVKDRHANIFLALQKNGAIEVLPTEMVGKVKVSNTPVKPKKTLIIAVALVLGLILGVFVALIRQAIKKRKAS